MKILPIFVCCLFLISCEKKQQGYCYRCAHYGYSNGSQIFDVVKDTCSPTPLPEFILIDNVQGNDIPATCTLK